MTKTNKRAALAKIENVVNDDATLLASYIAKLNAAFDERKRYERDEKKNDKIIAKIDKLQKDIVCESVARVLFSAHVDANFINFSQRSTSRYNIYAAQKVENISRALLNLESLNHFSRAILATCDKMRQNNMKMTSEDAKVACSNTAKSRDKSRQAFIVQYAKHVDASTISTQSSSSLNALQTFNLLRTTRDSANNEVFEIIDSEFSRALLAQV